MSGCFHFPFSTINFPASITASATLHPFGLAHCSSRRTEGSRRHLHGFQDGGKHRAGLLSKKPLCRSRPVRTREQEVVHGSTRKERQEYEPQNGKTRSRT